MRTLSGSTGIDAYNHLLEAYSHAQVMAKVDELLLEMRRGGVQSNEATFDLLLRICRSTTAVDGETADGSGDHAPPPSTPNASLSDADLDTSDSESDGSDSSDSESEGE